MELTKADKKRIDDETNKIIMRINIEATEYAELYEQTYLDTLAKKIEAKREASAYVAQRSLEMANKQLKNQGGIDMAWTEDVPSIEELKRFEGAKSIKDNNMDELNLTRTERVLLDKHRAIINMEKSRLMQRVCMWLHENLGYYDRHEIHIGKSYEERVIEDLQKAIWGENEE